MFYKNQKLAVRPCVFKIFLALFSPDRHEPLGFREFPGGRVVPRRRIEPIALLKRPSCRKGIKSLAGDRPGFVSVHPDLSISPRRLGCADLPRLGIGRAAVALPSLER